MVSAAQGHVLPEQHPGSVGSVVEGGSRDVAGHPEEVQAGVTGQLQVPAGRLGRHRCQVPVQGWNDGPPQEQPLAVHLPHVVLHLDRPEADGAHRRVADQAVLGGYVQYDVVQWLVPHLGRPPERRARYPDRPFDPVFAAGQGLAVAVVDAKDPGPENRRPGSVGVDHGPQRQGGYVLGGPGAHHADVLEVDRSREAQAHGLPDTSGVVAAGAALGGACQGSLLVGVADRRTGHLHGQEMLGT